MQIVRYETRLACLSFRLTISKYANSISIHLNVADFRLLELKSFYLRNANERMKWIVRRRWLFILVIEQIYFENQLANLFSVGESAEVATKIEVDHRNHVRFYLLHSMPLCSTPCTVNWKTKTPLRNSYSCWGNWESCELPVERFS